jgi:small conductance mechanosensitive channel
MNFKMSKIKRLILITLITISLIIIYVPKTNAQFSLFSRPSSSDIPETPSWDLNKARRCGKYWCSNVHIYGDGKISRGELILANAGEDKQTSAEIAFDVEQRAKLIQTIFYDIFTSIIKSQVNYQVPYQKDLKFWLFSTQKPLHPLTPIIEVGTENQQTVVYTARQPQLGLAQQAIATVTEVDAKANAMSMEELAQEWRNQIRNSLSQALWGYEMDRQRPGLRLNFSLVIGLVTFLIIFSLNFIRKLFKKWDKQLRLELEKIAISLRSDPEAIQKQENKDKEEKKNPEESIVEEIKEQIKQGHLGKFLNKIFHRSLAGGKQVLSESLEISKKIVPKVYRKKQSILKQQLNFVQLLFRVISLNQLTTLLLGIGVIITIFRQTRFLFNLFFNQALMLPLIWIGIVLLDKFIDFWIDYCLHQWAEERHELYPESNRPTLRVNTYSPAIKGATSFSFIVVGIFITFWIIGVNPNLLTGVGIFTVIFAFLSRNLVEDMLNGMLILATDRYAVGDFVSINDFAGYVETMNLYTTSLRNLDGQLIVLPNGKISTVINMTKEWSRVNLTVEIAWNTDIQKTIKIIREVADQMYNEPQWQEKIMEPATILGVDNISHEGITIRLLIKTQPAQQWATGREFRMRLKQAFDLAGISPGIPQREIWHHLPNSEL